MGGPLSSRQNQCQQTTEHQKRAKGTHGSARLSLKSPTPPHASLGTLLGTYYQRLCRRMEHKKAIVALAHRIPVIIYHLLKEHQPYRELGPEHVDEKAAEMAKRRALRTLEQLGYDVSLQSTEVA